MSQGTPVGSSKSRQRHVRGDESLVARHHVLVYSQSPTWTSGIESVFSDESYVLECFDSCDSLLSRCQACWASFALLVLDRAELVHDCQVVTNYLSNASLSRCFLGAVLAPCDDRPWSAAAKSIVRCHLAKMGFAFTLDSIGQRFQLRHLASDFFNRLPQGSPPNQRIESLVEQNLPWRNV